ncbi:MAG: hypothetical protein GXY54_01465 [Deltaproteobacteria bacterium]|nr:hypothetical protein [Deltaproteobacteria bacterium]
MASRKSRISMAAVVFVAATLLGMTAWADDVTDSINEALQAYQKGDLAEAVQNLNYASQLIQQKKGEGLASLLPGPLAGWTAEDATSQAATAAMFGGGVTAERRYSKDAAGVTIQVVADSPLLQGVMMMFSNPMFATADGGKMEKIGAQKAIVKYDAAGKSGDIKIVVANRFLVTVEGRDADLADMKAYAAAVDYQKLAALP